MQIIGLQRSFTSKISGERNEIQYSIQFSPNSIQKINDNNNKQNQKYFHNCPVAHSEFFSQTQNTCNYLLSFKYFV